MTAPSESPGVTGNATPITANASPRSPIGPTGVVRTRPDRPEYCSDQ